MKKIGVENFCLGGKGFESFFLSSSCWMMLVGESLPMSNSPLFALLCLFYELWLMDGRPHYQCNAKGSSPFSSPSRRWCTRGTSTSRTRWARTTTGSATAVSDDFHVKRFLFCWAENCHIKQISYHPLAVSSVMLPGKPCIAGSRLGLGYVEMDEINQLPNAKFTRLNTKIS